MFASLSGDLLISTSCITSNALIPHHHLHHNRPTISGKCGATTLSIFHRLLFDLTIVSINIQVHIDIFYLNFSILIFFIY